MWDSSIQGFRLKKRLAGSRYTQMNFHKHEIRLTKILESYYGSPKVVTSFHPKWALTDKDVLFEYDIYIKSLNLLIEYNGIQHYKYTPFFHHERKKFLVQKDHDKKKKQLAKENKYKLMIFRYDEPVFADYVLTKIKNNLDSN